MYGGARSHNHQDSRNDASPQIYLNIYGYEPSKSAAYIFTGLFFIFSFLHLFQLVRTRTWFFLPFLIGGLMESIGFVFRSVSVSQSPDYTAMPFFFGLLFILLAPIFFSASLNLQLTCLIRMCDAEHHAIVGTTWLSKILISGDFLSFITQLVGATILSRPDVPDLQITTGRAIIVVGFVVQIAFLVFYIVTATLFHVRYLKQDGGPADQSGLPWKRQMYVLYFGIGAIFVRCIYRLIEYAAHPEALVLQEWSFYVFDVALMLAMMLSFATVHPSEINALLKHRGMICRYFFVFTKPGAPAKYMEMCDQQIYSRQSAGAHAGQQYVHYSSGPDYGYLPSQKALEAYG